MIINEGNSIIPRKSWTFGTNEEATKSASERYGFKQNVQCHRFERESMGMDVVGSQ